MGEGDIGNQLFSAQVASAAWPSPIAQRVAILRVRAIAACTVGGANDVTNIEAQGCTDVAAIRLALPCGGVEWERGTGCRFEFVDAGTIWGTGARWAWARCTNSCTIYSSVILLTDNAKPGVHTTVNRVDAHLVKRHTCKKNAWASVIQKCR